MKQISVPAVLLTIGALASIASGILLVAGFALHPAGEDATFGTDPFWIPAHGLLWAAFAISLPGWIAVYLRQAAKAGRLGAVALVVVVVGTSLASWIFSSDVTFVPTIAAEIPGLFKHIFSPTHILLGVASVLAWTAGNVLVGISIIRARVYSKWPGIFLIAGSALIPAMYLTGLPVKAIAFAALWIAAGQIWLGLSLLQYSRLPLQD